MTSTPLPADPEARWAAVLRRDAAASSSRRARSTAAAARGEARVPLAALARATGTSAAHLQRAFTRLVGVSPARPRSARARRWKEALRTEGSVSRAVYAAGYAAPSRAYAAAASHLGMTPAAYRRGGDGLSLIHI